MDDPATGGPDPADEINMVGALLEPNRRALYDYVVERRAWVSREQAADAVDAAARRAGQRIGSEARDRVNGRSSRPKRREALFAELRKQGFEPETGDDGVTVLHNCPFHQLSQEHPELICGMNLGLLGGVLEGLEEVGLEARLEPEPGHCCVRFHDTDAAGGASRQPPAGGAVS